MQEDFRLIIKQFKKEFSLKDVALVAYRTAVQKLINSFLNVRFKHVAQAYNKHADVLATLASIFDASDGTDDVWILKSTSGDTITDPS